MSFLNTNIFISYLLFALTNYKGVATISAEDVRAEGPGLYPQSIVLPVRYFDVFSNNSKPISASDLEVAISGISKNKSPCRLWKQVLCRKDGSFIVRYRLYETCFDFTINILYKSAQVENFPQVFSGPVHHEDCNCPMKNLDEWLETFHCSEVPQQIKDDLRKYPSVNFNNFHGDFIKRFNESRSSSVCHYVIKSNKVHRTCYGQHTDFKVFMDSILLSLTRKVVLPDLEFYSNIGDWPLVKKGHRNNYPMFSWCGSTDTDDIVMPTYDLSESTLGAMDRVSLDMLSVQGNIERIWEEKETKAFWRGRDANLERLKLIELSRKHPDLINASLTNVFFFPEAKEKYAPIEKHISFFKFFDYKYQLNIDGTVAAYRFPYLLVGDSLVFKQESKYYEYFYSQLTPWKQYVPIKSDLSNLIQRLKWAIENDSEARKIAKAGRDFARKNILPQNIFCYYVHLFKEWSKNIDSLIVVRKEMELVSNKNENEGCICDSFNSDRKDEL